MLGLEGKGNGVCQAQWQIYKIQYNYLLLVQYEYLSLWQYNEFGPESRIDSWSKV